MKRIGVLLLTCILMLTLTACGEKNTADAVVVEVGGVSVKRTEAMEIYDAMLKQTALMYQQYGIPLDTTNEELITTIKSQTLNMIGEQLAMEQGLKKLGHELTQEDKNTIEAAAKKEYDDMLAQYTANYGVSSEEAETAAQEAGFTLKALQFTYIGDEITARLREHFVSDVVATDDEILEEFDTLIAEKKQAYEDDPTQFATDVVNEEMVVYRPEGFRLVQNIVIALPDAIMAEVDEKEQALYDVSYQLYVIDTQLNAGDLDADTKLKLEADYEAYTAQSDKINAELEALTKKGLEEVREKALEVLALCKAEGADFDVIMAEYSADKATGDLLTRGYPVSETCTAYVPSFTSASMALQNIGDISELVESEYGFHILKYKEDVVTGVVPLEDVKDSISETVLANKQDAALNDAISTIVGDAGIKVYITRF